MFARHLTLTPGQVATVTLDRRYPNVEILSRDGAAEVYYTRDGRTPTVKGDDTFVLVGAMSGVQTGLDQDEPDTIKLISTGTVEVSVLGW